MTKSLTRVEVSKRKQKKFLDVLARTGNITRSAKAVGYADTTYLRRLKKSDKDFSEKWEMAYLSGSDMLLDEAQRRALHGIEEEIYYKGEVVGTKLVYSDAVLMFLIRGQHPDKYGQGVGKGGAQINFGVAILPMQAANEQAWEERTIEMHAGQEVIILEPKPDEPSHVIQVVRA